MSRDNKAPSEADMHIGGRVRMRRLLMGISQEKLGEALGVTFQQVQKYEKGTNRISAGRLQRIGAVLGVPASYFYEGLEGLHEKERASGFETTLVDVLNTHEGLRLAKAFAAIEDRHLRGKLAELAEAVSRSRSGF